MRHLVLCTILLLLCALLSAATSPSALTPPLSTPAPPSPSPEEGTGFFQPVWSHRLDDFMLSWSFGDIEQMLSLCSPEWAEKQADPTRALFQLTGAWQPFAYSVTLISQEQDSASGLLYTRMMGPDGAKSEMDWSFRMICLDGRWYLDPDQLSIKIGPAAIPPDMTLYFNPEGGRYYHADPNCPSISPRYLPLTSSFSFSEVNDPAYRILLPCSRCGAPRRPVDASPTVTPSPVPAAVPSP